METEKREGKRCCLLSLARTPELWEQWAGARLSLFSYPLDNFLWKKLTVLNRFIPCTAEPRDHQC